MAMVSIFDKKTKYLCEFEPKSHVEPDTHFILKRDAVIAQQAKICGKINMPTTIIQFIKDGVLDRIDSPVYATTFRTSCAMLRRCVNEKDCFCQRCDAAHARLFYNITEDQLKSGEIEERIKENKIIWDKEFSNPHYQPEMEVKHERYFLSYNCPIFGYKELIFPIIFGGKVIAVFFVGQIKLKTDVSKVADSKENFFKMYPNVIEKYLQNCGRHKEDNPEKYNNTAIISFIKNSERNNKHEYPWIFPNEGLTPKIPPVYDILYEKSYKSILAEVCNWLTTLEKQLCEDEMAREHEKSARAVFEQTTGEFYESEAFVGHPISAKEFWGAVSALAKDIAEKCELEYMVFYGATQENNEKVIELHKVAYNNPETHGIAPSVFSLMNSPMNNLMYQPKNSNTMPELYDVITPKCTERDLTCIIVQPMKAIPAATVAVIVKYKSVDLKETIDKVLVSRLHTLVALISSRLAVRFENETQMLLKKTMSVYRHEMVNLISDVSRIVRNYLGKPEKLKSLNIIDLQKAYEDALNTINLFEFFSENIGALLEDNLPIAKKEDICLYKDVISKWARIKKPDAEPKGCVFALKEFTAKVITDPRYVELVVYNLFTNAVKYSYHGTNIYVHLTPDNIFSLKNCMLSVTNFSFEISEVERDKIFHMGHRMEEAKMFFPSGSGIGLWLVRKVMNHLKGSVRLCKPKQISRYNIPLLHEYVNNSSLYKDMKNVTLQEAQDEHNRLLNKYRLNDYGQRVNLKSWVLSNDSYKIPSKKFVQSGIIKPTYMIRFEVEFNV